MGTGLIWTACDLLCVGYGFNPAITRDRYYPPTAGLEWLQQDKSAHRILAGGRTLAPDTAEVYGLSDARGLDYMGVRRYEELITGKAGAFFFYRRADAMPAAFPLLNVKYIMGEGALPLNPRLFDLVYSNEVCIYQYKECRERAMAVYDCQVEPDSKAVLDRVRADGFDPRRVLLLEQEPEAAKKASGAGGGEESVRIVSYEPDEVSIEATLPRAGYLLLLDTYFPGWTATVNGRPARIMRADYNFRAVALGAGESTVRFTYFPRSLETGLLLSAAGAAWVWVAWLLGRSRKRED